MPNEICSNCKLWYYSRFTEDNYGMGVGRCEADGQLQFCEHKCPFCVPREENDNA